MYPAFEWRTPDEIAEWRRACGRERRRIELERIERVEEEARRRRAAFYLVPYPLPSLESA